MIKRVNLDQTGLGMFLGSTEAHVMCALWAGPKTLQEIHVWIIKHRNPSQGYSAVNTVLARLIEKEYVAKHVEGNQHAIYRPMTINEKDFIFKCLLVLHERLLINYPIQFTRSYESVMQERERRVAEIIRFIPPKDDV